ncbi:MAG: lipoyl(octanoyl) transferase LipB [Flavobacteriaceae bacterium]|nr:lipoyl(octanoyl) transferase LipB [Flavobacteriaceae bacterium]MDG1920035.1 lipoyl(octanoyl) transferase LipB [Flavobacteriaceae bacterium]
MTQKNKTIQLIELGLKSYQEALAVQEKLFNQTIAIKRANRNQQQQTRTENYLLWVEHTPVITLGKSGKSEHLLLDENQLKKKGIEYYPTNRGGDITFHGPGQLVGYPILDLDNFFTDIHKYLRFLEEAIILTLEEYGLKGARSDGETGVWLDVGTPFARKICAMGVKASRWVTMHGFALNINTDLSYFEYIVPCGIQGKAVTSLEKELGRNVPFEEVKTKLKVHFADLFKAEMQQEEL